MTIITVRFSKSRESAVSNQGFTLAELLITMGLMGLIMTAILSSYIFITKSSMSMGNYAEMNEQARMAVEIFARDIRMTSDVLYVGEGEMSLEVSYSQDDVQTVDYIYDSDAGEFIRIVRRIVGKDSKFVILDDLIDLEIKFLNLIDAETENLLEIKRIHFSAKMLKKVLHIANTNQVISAQYMMRNRKVAN